MNDRQQSQSFRNMPRPQKVAVISLLLIAIGITAVWFWQSSSRINSPFRASDAEIAQAKKTAQLKAAQELADRTKDSDNDGLSDYDEINIHKTSPYLEDTDGDGMSDFDELKLGTNPLCDEKNGVGQCGAMASNINALDNTTGSISSSTLNQNPIESVDQALMIQALSGEGTADTMRQILLQGGADPEQVKLLSDDDLMAIYIDILKAQNPDAVIDTTPVSSTSSATSTNQ